jgi:hypothetical protein
VQLRSFVTFDQFVLAIDEQLKSAVRLPYGLYQGPHVAFWHAGAFTARVRAGTRDDAELMLVSEDEVVGEPLHVRCEAEGVVRFASAISGVLG